VFFSLHFGLILSCGIVIKGASVQVKDNLLFVSLLTLMLLNGDK